MDNRFGFAALVVAALLGALFNRWAEVGMRHYTGARSEGTPYYAVREMLALAGVRPGDVVADLGCGDGRVAISAVRDFGAEALCVERDAKLLQEALRLATLAGVDKRIRFELADLFTTSLSGVTVVTLFLLPELNERLRPKLLTELSKGSRVVSYQHDMGTWRPDAEASVAVDLGRRAVYLWRIP